MLEKGFVKIYRSMIDWEWYGDIITTRVFLHLLLTVNIKETRWQGVTVPRGSRVCSLSVLSEETGLSVKQIRGTLDKLIRTGEVARLKYPKFSIISIKNWDNFQSKAKVKGTEREQNRAQEGQQNKNIKNKESSLDTLKGVSKEGEEKPKSQYREVGADEW